MNFEKGFFVYVLENDFLTGVDSVVEDSSKRKETEVVGGSSAADEAEPSLEEKTIPSSITNVPNEMLGGMSQSFYFSSSYRDLE